MGGRRISLTSANDADVRIVVKNKKVTIRLSCPKGLPDGCSLS